MDLSCLARRLVRRCGRVVGALVIGVGGASLLVRAEPDFAHPWNPATPLPHFITHDFVDPSYLVAISKYRSNAGHSFSDNYEGVDRSLKNYFEPRSAYRGTRQSLPVFAPAAGTLASVTPESQVLGNGEHRGNQLSLTPDGFPAFEIRLFHVNLAAGLHAGSHVNAGDPLGYADLRESVDCDWAVGAAWNATPPFVDPGQALKAPGYRLLSPFDCMDDANFANYAAYGLTDRSSLVVSLEERAAHPGLSSGQDLSHFDPAEFAVLLTSPDITFQPSSVYASPGSLVTFTVVGAAQGAPLSYQWYRNGVPLLGLPGAQAFSVVVSPVKPEDMGIYWATVTANGRTSVSAHVVLTVDTGGSSRLMNVSTRGVVPADGALTPGFVVGGVGTKSLVIRGIGPALANFAVAGALPDPRLDVIPLGGSATVLSNDNWTASGALEIASNAAGAFPLPPGSRDAAVLASLPSTNGTAYTVRVTPAGAPASGIALAEVYDTDALSAPTKLFNVSTLGYAGTGDQSLIVGFVVGGTAPKQLLIRGIGPGLADYKVTGLLKDPKITVTPLGESYSVADNAGWAGAAALKAAFASAGAFALNPASTDAALVVRLPPGGYTVVASSVSGGTGNVLIEVYDLDP